MRKIISVLLAVVMLVAPFAFASSAAPENNCMKFGDPHVYVYFGNIALNPTDSEISFDLSMAADSEGKPILNMNGEIDISTDYVKVGGTRKNVSWGTAEVTHWRHIDIVYAGGTCTLSVDGTAVLSASANARASGLYLLCAPGYLNVDNFVVRSSGSAVFDMDFEDSDYYYEQADKNSSAAIGAIPAGSYYDYEEVIVPENVSYIFSDSTACAKLSVSSGKKLIAGDIDGNNRLTSSDTLNVKKIVAGMIAKPANGTGDVNGDGRYNSNDIRTLKMMVVGSTAKRYIEVASGASAVYDSDMQSALLTSSADVTKGVDATLSMDKITASDYKYAVVTYMTPFSEENKNSSAATKSAFGEKTSLTEYALTVDGRFHSQIIDLSEISAWDGASATLRFFIAASKGDRLYVDSIVFCANESKANAVKSARESAKAEFSITDKPAPSGLGSWDGSSYVIRFDSAEKVEYITSTHNASASYASGEKALKATLTVESDPSIYLDLTNEGISADSFDYIVYVYKIPTSNRMDGPAANMYYVCGNIDVPTGGYETEIIDCLRQDKYNGAIMNVGTNSNWAGTLKGLRMDFFTEAYKGDCVYIDSVIFGSSYNSSDTLMKARLVDRNGEEEDPVTPSSGYPAADVWNLYRTAYKNANPNEYVTGSGADTTMYFRFGSLSKFTARSLGDRMARAITNATGKTVTCEIYQGYLDLRDAWDSGEPVANVFYNIHYEGESYTAWCPTRIIKDSSYSDVLDGTSADPVVEYENVSNWSSEGVSITDSSKLADFTNNLAYHSNHENKLIDTPYGTFAFYCVSADDLSWADFGGSTYYLMRIYDNGTYRVIGTYQSTYHTTKGQIYYAADGLVYFFTPDVQQSGGSECASMGVGYFDPSAPNGDGSYNITYWHGNMSFPGGEAPGGFGYSMPILDDVNGKFYIMYNGGRDELGYYMSWFIYNYRTHSFENGACAVSYTQYRHSYPYAYADGKGGFWFVAERGCLLECVGLKGIVTGVNYAWDQLTLFHVTNAKTGAFTEQEIVPPDYTQTDRYLFPVIANNICGDTYLSDDGILHVIYSTRMTGSYHHDTRYYQLTHSIFDLNTPGKATKLYSEPIAFGNTSNNSCCRFVTSTSGQLYILAMHQNRAPRCEVWKATDTLGSQFKMVACQNFSSGGSGVPTAAVYGVKRNGSVIDNTIECMFPVAENGIGAYYYFRVTLPE